MQETEHKEATQARLTEIDSELKELNDKLAELKGHWSKEKKLIARIRNYKAQIEEQRNLADNLELEGNLEKVAEIRYGVLHDLEHKLKDANEKLNALQSEGKMLKEEVLPEDIAEVVAKWTGIPVQKMLESERMKLVKMEERIHRRLIGQEHAVSSVANAIRRSRAGLQDENRPVGSFIFIGTSGVGKTELARALAEFLFDDENALIRIDMSEYMEKFSVSRLIGAPPGYVGYEEGGQLTEAVRQKPYSVVLLDEIEKASQEVFNVLLQLLDDGRLTDGKGRTVNFKNTVIIMTSNLGTELIREQTAVLAETAELTEDNRESLLSKVKVQILNLLRQTMRPEFLNRIDEIILFKPLLLKEIRQIASLQFDILRRKMESAGIEIDISDSALDWISDLGFDTHYGARPLKRAIQKHISDPLAMKILSGDFAAGDKIMIDSSDGGGFIFKKV